MSSPKHEVNTILTTSSSSHTKSKGRKSTDTKKCKGGLRHLKRSIQRLRKTDKNENDDKKWKSGASRLVYEVGDSLISPRVIHKNVENRDDAWLIDDNIDFKNSWPEENKDKKLLSLRK